MTANDDQREPVAAAFVSNLRRYRERAGLSQSEVAARARSLGAAMHQQTIAKIEGGTRSVTLDEAHALARAVGRPFAEMFRPPPESLTGAAAKAELKNTTRAVGEVAGRLRKAEGDLEKAKLDAFFAEVEATRLREQLDELEERESILLDVVHPTTKRKRS